MLGMRTFDLIKCIDFLKSRKDLKGRKIVVIGEGLGGLWALTASVNDPRINGIVTVGTLPSYKLLVTNQYYNVWGYFWVPGALRDYDIPDMARLISPKPQVWINPVNNLAEVLSLSGVEALLGSFENLHIFVPENQKDQNISEMFNKIFE
jgi:pimeloyl-ACP methyl ester carboxylesterase